MGTSTGYLGSAAARGASALDVSIAVSIPSVDPGTFKETRPDRLASHRRLGEQGRLARAGSTSDATSEELDTIGRIACRAASMLSERVSAEANPVPAKRKRGFASWNRPIGTGRRTIGVGPSTHPAKLS